MCEIIALQRAHLLDDDADGRTAKGADAMLPFRASAFDDSDDDKSYSMGIIVKVGQGVRGVYLAPVAVAAATAAHRNAALTTGYNPPSSIASFTSVVCISSSCTRTSKVGHHCRR